MDDIRRELAFIDDQLADGTDFYKDLLTKAPLLFAAAGLIIGITLEKIFSLRGSLWLILLGVFAVSTVLIFLTLGKNTFLRLSLVGFCTLLSFTCLGGIRLLSFNKPTADDISNFVGSDRLLATIRGTIISRPYVAERQWQFARFTHSDPASSFYIRITHAETTVGWAETGGTVRVWVDGPVLDLAEGDNIEMYSWQSRFAPTTNPGQFDSAEYLARRNITQIKRIRNRKLGTILHAGLNTPE